MFGIWRWSCFVLYEEWKMLFLMKFKSQAWNPTLTISRRGHKDTESGWAIRNEDSAVNGLLFSLPSNRNSLLTRLHGGQELYVRLSSAGKEKCCISLVANGVEVGYCRDSPPHQKSIHVRYLVKLCIMYINSFLYRYHSISDDFYLPHQAKAMQSKATKEQATPNFPIPIKTPDQYQTKNPVL